VKIEEAKLVLTAFRPGSSDDQDPEMREALEMARSHPELAEFLERQMRFHAEIKAQLRSIPVPEDLRAKILAGHKIIPVRHWTRGPVAALLAAAAAVVVLISGLLFWNAPTSENHTFAGFQSRMASEVLRVYAMDIRTNDAAVVRKYLASKGAPSEFSLPPKLQKAPLLGGAKLSWQAKPVSMVCFQGPKMETLFLFVIQKEEIESGKIPVAPEMEQIKGMSSVSWSAGDHVYFLSGKVPESELRDLLAAGGLTGKKVAAL
jgi:hypothetical protein